MKKAEESTKIFNLSPQPASSFSGELIHEGLESSTTHEPNSEDGFNGDELELTLGLSMNGRFGVEPRNKKLKRSSSISDFPLTIGNAWDDGGACKAFESHAQLLQRARSLPTEAEEELRKRKAYQSMRRLEARKKRLEKMKSGSRLGRGKVSISSSEDIGGNKVCAAGGGLADEDDGGSHVLKNTSMAEMPYVTTKETGPNGRKTEGFLYGYKKGEDVRIVCVCHGLFLSPAEFVRHGGGGGDAGEVEHPLKHIVVSPFPLL